MQIKSRAFEDVGSIPSKFTCDGEGVSPPLEIIAIPREAKTLVLIMDDPDAATGMWDHWVIFNIPNRGEILEIGEGSEPDGVGGVNSWGKTGYGGPCPHQGKHRYFFKVYALDAELSLPHGSKKEDVETAMNGHVIAESKIIGLYER